MPDGEMQSAHIPSDNNDLSSVFRENVRQAAEQITIGQAALGAAGVTLVVLLTVSGLLPLVPSSTLATNPVLGWLANLGSNALAGWLASWAQRNAGHLFGKNDETNQALLQEMAIDLQTTLVSIRKLNRSRQNDVSR